ncbi:MAG: TolC family protein [Clostridium sp.]|nr:TolC family protein [Bacteroides sp.]MCM1198877.1 TolC family protein [Clostridium sp.]
MKRIILLTAAAAMACSCGIYKKYERPESVQADSLLFGEEFATADSASVADLGWKELFTDPMLQSLIEKGLENNTDLRAARLHTEEAEIALKTARLSYIPSFNFAADGGVSSFNNYNGVKAGASWTYTVPVVASWEIDIFGKKTNEKRQSKAAWEMSKDYEQATMTGLIASIASQYYTLVMLDEQLRIAQSTAEKFSQSVTVLKAMKEAGMANEVAVAQMEGAYWQVCASVQTILQTIRQLENSICTTLCETSHSIERGELSGMAFPETLKTGVPVQLLSRRPDVRAAENNLAAAYYATNASKASMYPSLSLGGTIGWTNNAGTPVTPGGLIMAATGSLLQPIFNARANVAKVKIMKSQQEEARLNFQQAILDAGAEVNNALTQYQTSQARAEFRTRQIESLSAAVDKTELLMQYTSTTYLEVLTAQQSLLSAQTSLAQDRYDMIAGVISLYRALGGGQQE